MTKPKWLVISADSRGNRTYLTEDPVTCRLHRWQVARTRKHARPYSQGAALALADYYTRVWGKPAHAVHQSCLDHLHSN